MKMDEGFYLTTHFFKWKTYKKSNEVNEADDLFYSKGRKQWLQVKDNGGR